MAVEEVSVVSACSNGNIRYHWRMNRRLSSEQIKRACRELLHERRHVSVRALMRELRQRHGAAGRTERVARLLKLVEDEVAAARPSVEEGAEGIEKLHEQLRDAQARATRAEEIERSHQDFWARRYAEKVDELEKRYAAALKARAPISPDQYLRLHQEMAQLRRRLAQCEQGAEGAGSPE